MSVSQYPRVVYPPGRRACNDDDKMNGHDYQRVEEIRHGHIENKKIDVSSQIFVFVNDQENAAIADQR